MVKFDNMKKLLLFLLLIPVCCFAQGQGGAGLSVNPPTVDHIQDADYTSFVQIQDTGGIHLSPLAGQSVDIGGGTLLVEGHIAGGGQLAIYPTDFLLVNGGTHMLDWSDVAHSRIILGSGIQLSSNDTNTYFDDTGFHGSGASLTGVVAANHSLSAYATGTVYTMTNSDALVDFGTTDPTIVLDQAGTYLLLGRAYLKYNGATYAGTQTATVHLRRTNNTAADVSNATTTATMRIITTITDSVGIMEIPPVIYTTAGTTDSISVFGSLSAAPAAGSVQAAEASIVAIRIL